MSNNWVLVLEGSTNSSPTDAERTIKEAIDKLKRDGHEITRASLSKTEGAKDLAPAYAGATTR